jgi:uncharacterized membrane protein YbaN (DUF454 family)
MPNEPPKPSARTAVQPAPWHDRPKSTFRKVVALLVVAGCLVMSVVGGLLPFLQGWLFLVIGLYVLATEFETGRKWVLAARRRWPWISHQIHSVSTHRWAPRHLKEFEKITSPGA